MAVTILVNTRDKNEQWKLYIQNTYIPPKTWHLCLQHFCILQAYSGANLCWEQWKQHDHLITVDQSLSKNATCRLAPIDVNVGPLSWLNSHGPNYHFCRTPTIMLIWRKLLEMQSTTRSVLFVLLERAQNYVVQLLDLASLQHQNNDSKI